MFATRKCSQGLQHPEPSGPTPFQQHRLITKRVQSTTCQRPPPRAEQNLQSRVKVRLGQSRTEPTP